MAPFYVFNSSLEPAHAAVEHVKAVVVLVEAAVVLVEAAVVLDQFRFDYVEAAVDFIETLANGVAEIEDDIQELTGGWLFTHDAVMPYLCCRIVSSRLPLATSCPILKAYSVRYWLSMIDQRGNETLKTACNALRAAVLARATGDAGALRGPMCAIAGLEQAATNAPQNSGWLRERRIELRDALDAFAPAAPRAMPNTDELRRLYGEIIALLQPAAHEPEWKRWGRF